MSTIFALLCRVCGLSHREAAAFLDVRLDTVKSWSSGRNSAPDRVLDDLAELAAKIDRAADEAVDLIAQKSEKHGPPDTIDLQLSQTDEDAQERGWPCVGAHHAVLGLTIARGMAEGFCFSVTQGG